MKSLLKKRYLITILAAVGYVVLFVDFRMPHDRHFSFELDDRESIVHYEQNKAGFSDRHYSMVYSKNETNIVQKIIEDWGLKHKSLFKDEKYNTRPISFTAVWDPKPEWWPSTIELNEIEESYMRILDHEERYWSMWVPSNENVVYIERGSW